jgi:hypothetical protein
MSLLVPALTMVKRFAKRVTQKNQFHGIQVALDLFNAEWEDYPPSGLYDEATPPQPYCGSMKLCEAMVGQDLLGFHPDSRFLRDGTDGLGVQLYDPSDPDRSGRRQYLKPDSANGNRVQDLYSSSGVFNQRSLLLCDVYFRVTHRSTGRFTGMPVLYYKADISRTAHNVDNPLDPENIYRFSDNHRLVELGIPWDPASPHPLFADPRIFYQRSLNPQIEVTGNRPYNADSYILLSGGFDGIYGTDDDIYNFGL